MKFQFTINPQGRVTVTSAGVVIQDHLAASRDMGHAPHRPAVAVSVDDDLRLRLAGARFDAEAQLTRADAAALIAKLSSIISGGAQ